MPDYIYTREIVSGSYDIENPARIDGESNQIHLAKEVEAAIPGKTFKMICNDTEAKFEFDEALSSPEQTTLASIVSDHKNNI